MTILPFREEETKPFLPELGSVAFSTGSQEEATRRQSSAPQASVLYFPTVCSKLVSRDRNDQPIDLFPREPAEVRSC